MLIFIAEVGAISGGVISTPFCCSSSSSVPVSHPSSVAVLLGPGVEEVADLPRRVAGAATVHFEDEREEARPGRGADRGRGRHMAVEAVALAAGRRASARACVCVCVCVTTENFFLAYTSV